MARVHRLEHVERLRAANLAHDDPVGAHAQGVPHELPDRDLAGALDVLRPGLEAQHVVLLQLELGGVLDGDDALRIGDRLRERVQERRLARARPAGDQEVELGEHAALEEVDGVVGERAQPDELVQVEPLVAELADRHERAAQRERWDDCVHTAPVREARVHHRRRLVDPPPDLGDHLVDDPA